MLRGTKVIRWYWKVIPNNEPATPMTPDPANPGAFLKNPNQYFEGVRGIATTRNDIIISSFFIYASFLLTFIEFINNIRILT